MGREGIHVADICKLYECTAHMYMCVHIYLGYLQFSTLLSG